MKHLIKNCLPFFIVIPCCFIIPLILGWDGSMLHWETASNGMHYLKFSPYDYFYNIGFSVDSFKNSFVRFTELHFNFTTILNSLRSIGNIFIAMLNLFLLPFALVSNVLIFIMALLGFPCTEQNFIYTTFNLGSMLQIPYFTYLWE